MRFLGVISLLAVLLFGCTTKAVNEHEWKLEPTGEVLMGTIFFNVTGDQDQLKAVGKFVLENFEGPIAWQGFKSNFYVLCENAEQIDKGTCSAIPARLLVVPHSGQQRG